VLKGLTYESFHVGLNKAFGHAADPAAAYEQLRRKLIQYFHIRGHSADAEYLADNAMDRVLAKVSDGYVHIVDDKSVSNYALGVARHIIMEQRRTNQGKQSELSSGSYLRAFQQEDSFEVERYYEALDSCLKKLKPEDRKLITKYYEGRPGATKRLAAELRISHQALRVRAMRIRHRLKEMMDQYLES
jgi:RNA polymerase sigma factor (sigma-70 family)